MRGIETHRPVVHSSRTILRIVLAIGLLSIGACNPTQPARSTEQILALRHVTVIDGTGAPARDEQLVIVVGDRISSVGDAHQAKIPDGAHEIDASGLYVIPGLWDMHVHTRYQGIDFLGLFLAHGITGIRDMAGPWEHFEKIQQWKREIQTGNRLGPRIMSGGPLLDGAGSLWSHAAIVANPEAGREVVRRLKSEGADFVKVYHRLSRETFLSITEEAKRQGLPFLGHVPLSINAGEASEAGQKTIEHLDGVLLACSNEEERLRQEWGEDGIPFGDLIRTFSSEKAGRLFQVFVENQTWHVPTLVYTSTGLRARNGDPELLKSENLRYLPDAYKKPFLGSTPLAGSLQLEAAVYEKEVQLLALMHKAGIGILAGTDTLKPFLVPGVSLHDELELLVVAGLSPMEALQTATRNPAIFLGMADLGTVEAGKIADLVLLDSNPLDDIRNTRRISGVVVAGKYLERARLIELLQNAEQVARSYGEAATGR